MLALSLVVLIRVGALAALTGPVALVVVPAAHALSRGAVVVVMAVTRPATEEGLGASYAGRRAARRAVAGAAAAILVGGAGLGWWVMPALVLAGVASTAVAVPAVRRLGGVTGDVLGAVQQVAEATVLVLGAAALAGGVWWR